MKNWLVVIALALAPGCDDDGSDAGQRRADTRLEWPVDSGPFSTDVVRLDTAGHGDSDGGGHGSSDARDAHLDNHVHDLAGETTAPDAGVDSIDATD